MYEHARLPLHRLKQGGMWGIHDWPRWMETADEHALLPIVPGPADIYVMVAGGSGQALGRRPELLLLPRRHPEDHPLAAVTRPARHRAGPGAGAARPAAGPSPAGARAPRRSGSGGPSARPLALRLAAPAA